MAYQTLAPEAQDKRLMETLCRSATTPAEACSKESKDFLRSQATHSYVLHLLGNVNPNCRGLESARVSARIKAS
jgi:hypothetical protein